MGAEVDGEGPVTAGAAVKVGARDAAAVFSVLTSGDAAGAGAADASAFWVILLLLRRDLDLRWKLVSFSRTDLTPMHSFAIAEEGTTVGDP